MPTVPPGRCRPQSSSVVTRGKIDPRASRQSSTSPLRLARLPVHMPIRVPDSNAGVVSGFCALVRDACVGTVKRPCSAAYASPAGRSRDSPPTLMRSSSPRESRSFPDPVGHHPGAATPTHSAQPPGGPWEHLPSTWGRGGRRRKIVGTVARRWPPQRPTEPVSCLRRSGNERSMPARRRTGFPCGGVKTN